MPSGVSVEAVSTAFQDAALDATRWPDALETLSTYADAFGAALLPLDARVSIFPFTASLGELRDSYLREGWIDRDARYRGVATMKIKGVATDFDCVTEEDLRKDPYWQEWLAPLGLQWFAGLKIQFGDELWCASIQRETRKGPFDAAEIKRLMRVLPHLSAAGALASALGFARIDAALEAFQASSRAVLMINRKGKVARLNAAAERLLGHDLQVRNGQIVSGNPGATVSLQRSIHALLENVETDTPIVRLPRRNKPPVFAYIGAPGLAMFDLIGTCRCIVTLIEVGAPSPADEQIVLAAFGLTKAEARLAIGLAEGSSIEEAATGLQITYETARAHLRNIRLKMGVRRTAELTLTIARLLERLPRSTVA